MGSEFGVVIFHVLILPNLSFLNSEPLLFFINFPTTKLKLILCVYTLNLDNSVGFKAKALIKNPKRVNLSFAFLASLLIN